MLINEVEYTTRYRGTRRLERTYRRRNLNAVGVGTASMAVDEESLTEIGSGEILAQTVFSVDDGKIAVLYPRDAGVQVWTTKGVKRREVRSVLSKLEQELQKIPLRNPRTLAQMWFDHLGR